jgi:hypothetical protein
MTRVKTARAKRIPELNCRLRKEPANRSLGQVLISSGINVRGAEFRAMVLTAIASMQAKDFKIGNDPYSERDFNSFTVAAKLCLFNIDYYAKGNLQKPSDDPADPAKTERVLTVMLADEY